MASSLFPQNNSQQMSNNPMALLKQFNEFKKSMEGQDPKKVLEDMIASGKVSKQQVMSAAENLKQFKGILF